MVYLSLDGNNRPDQKSWSPEDKSTFEKLNVYAAAANNSNFDMVRGFLNACIEQNCTINEYSFIKQYSELLLYLGRKQVDMNLMKSFYNEMLIDSNYSSAQSIRSMLEDLIVYRRERLLSAYQNKFQPFDKIYPWSKNHAVFHGLKSIPDSLVKLDVICLEDCTQVKFWIPNPEPNCLSIKDILDKIPDKETIKWFRREDDNSYITELKFPDRDHDLCDFIDRFLGDLNKLNTL